MMLYSIYSFNRSQNSLLTPIISNQTNNTGLITNVGISYHRISEQVNYYKMSDKLNLNNLKRCFIIAEIGQNHQGDIALAKKLIQIAKVSRPSTIYYI